MNNFQLTEVNTGYIVMAILALAGAILYHAHQLGKKDQASKK